MLGDESDLCARMRLGMTGAVRRLGGARRVTGTSLVALLCASALAPVVVAAGVVVGPVLLAGVGVVGAVGAGVLTDVVTGAVDRLRSNGKEVSQASVEGELALRLEEALASQGNSASALREAVAALLQGVDAVAAVREATEAGDQNLVLLVAEGFAGLDERFNEFTPVIEDIRRALWDLQESARQQQAVTRIEQERGRQDSLMLLQVRQTLERWVTSAARPPEVVGPEDPMWSGCPYLGLVPFEERDARVFYGRSELVRQLVQRLLEHLDGSGILLVVGASGAGKSSLLRAGVMPSLEADALGPGSGKWPRRVIRPTASPMRELAGHLADMAGLEPVSVYLSLSAAPGEIPLLIERAVRTATGLGPDPVRDAPGDSTCMVPPRLVLIIDQFEELLTLGEDTDADPEEREARREQGEAFVTALQAAATMPAGPSGVPGALIVVAVRGDFLDRAIAYPPLAAAVQTGPFAVGPMSEAELRQAITGPAAEAGLAVEPALVEAVVSELRERAQGGLGSGALPLMSQAMAATWERREGNELTLRAYQRAGGITDAVNRSAQTAYDSLTSSQQDAARVVFIRLTAITQDGQLARRRCSRAELYSSEEGIKGDINAVIGVFSAQRLLVLGEDSIEISHDVLLNAWTKLREWLGDDQLDRALYSQVVNDADAWKANERDSSYLYRSGRLAAIDAATRRWANAPARYPRLPATSAEFLRASERADRRRVRQRRGVIAFLLVLVVGFASVAFGFFRANQNAVNQSHLAQSQSHRAQSEEMAAEAMNLLPANGPLAMLLSLQAYERFHTLQAESALIQASQQPLDYQLASGSPVVDSVAFSPDGKTLAAGGDDGHVGLWDVATGRRTTPWTKAARSTVSRSARAGRPSRSATLAATSACGTWPPGSRPLPWTKAARSTVSRSARAGRPSRSATTTVMSACGTWPPGSGPLLPWTKAARSTASRSARTGRPSPSATTAATSACGTWPPGSRPLLPWTKAARSKVSRSARTGRPSPSATTAATSACGTWPPGSRPLLPWTKAARSKVSRSAGTGIPSPQATTTVMSGCGTWPPGGGPRRWPKAVRSTVSRSAGTGKPSPPATTTVMSACGTWPPGGRPLPWTKAARSTVSRSARTGRPSPSATLAATSACGTWPPGSRSLPWTKAARSKASRSAGTGRPSPSATSAAMSACGTWPPGGRSLPWTKAARSKASRSARTGRPSPSATTTVMSACGTWPPGGRAFPWTKAARSTASRSAGTEDPRRRRRRRLHRLVGHGHRAADHSLDRRQPGRKRRVQPGRKYPRRRRRWRPCRLVGRGYRAAGRYLERRQYRLRCRVQPGREEPCNR